MGYSLLTPYKQQTQHSAQFNKLRVSTWVSEMEDLRDVIIWVTNHSLKKSKTKKKEQEALYDYKLRYCFFYPTCFNYFPI